MCASTRDPIPPCRVCLNHSQNKTFTVLRDCKKSLKRLFSVLFCYKTGISGEQDNVFFPGKVFLSNPRYDRLCKRATAILQYCRNVRLNFSSRVLPCIRWCRAEQDIRNLTLLNLAEEINRGVNISIIKLNERPLYHFLKFLFSFGKIKKKINWSLRLPE